MKTHTSGFKQEIKKYGKQLDSIISYVSNGETIELGNQNINSIAPHYEGSILKSVMKQLDIDSNVEIPQGTIINYTFGVKVRDNEVENYRDNYDYVNFGNYVVKEIEKKEDTNSWKITCYDKMLYSMKDYENLGITYPITIRNYINTICTHLGLTFKNINDTFANYNKQIQTELYLDSQGNTLGYTFRDVLDELAQVTGSTICINEVDDKLEIRYINNTGDTINEEYLKDINVNFGEKYGPINTVVLSRSGGADKVYKSYPDNLPDNQKNAVEIENNQIMNFNDRADYLPDILNKLNGLEYYLNDLTSTGIAYYNLCDKYNVQIGENIYSCVMFNDEVIITQGLVENIHTDMPEIAETDYTKADKTDRKINQTYIIVDKQNQTIQSVVSTVDQQNTKISQITQTVDELNSKISDIADITISGESNFATFTLDNINQSEPIQIKVKPISENISYLYPRNNLYPSSNLYSKNRKIRFHNNTTSEDIDYIIPDDLLIYDSETYDEFYLDYDSQTCQVIKRCKYNADGTVDTLSSEQIVDYPYPMILLDDGDYTLTLLGYEYGYLFVRLMAKNIYTSQFYTKSETDSHINQKASEIELGVNQTLSNYSTTSQMNAVINVKANQITSDVSETYATKTTTNQLSSRISQTAKGISLTVNNGSTSSGITIGVTKEDGTTSQTSGTIQMNGLVKFTDLSTSNPSTTIINGSNITTGILKSQNYVQNSAGTAISLANGSIDTKNFKVSSDGTIQATNVNVSGIINASGGLVGGWNLSNVMLNKSIGDYSFEIRSDRSENEAALLVYKNKGSNQGYKFYVRPDGYLFATNSNITGTINSSSGFIGGWNIYNNRLESTGSDGYSTSLTPSYLYAKAPGDTWEDLRWYDLVTGNYSDERLKNNIENIDNKYEKFFDNLRPVSFNFIEKFRPEDYDKKRFGFIAQDIIKNQKDTNIEELAMISGSEETKYKLDKEEIIALNTWQIQKLKAIVNEQQKQIDELREEINKLKGDDK